MKVLITGAHGFVGKHVYHELQMNYNHKLFAPTKNDWTHGNFALNLLDTWTFDAVATNIKFDAIIHLAGVVGGIGFNQNNQGKLGFENLQMGLNVLEIAKIHNIKKVIMLGTTCSYPRSPKIIPFIEEELFDGMPEITNSGYGIAKRTLVKLGIEYAHQYGIGVVNLIPTNMCGRYDNFDENSSHVIPAIIRKFESPQLDMTRSMFDVDFPGKYITLWGNGSASREFLDAEDCARAIAMALEQDIGPEPINLGTGREVTIKELADLIKEIGKYSASINWDTSKPNGQPRRSLDITRAKNILGWEPKISLEESIRKSIEWYRMIQTSHE